MPRIKQGNILIPLLVLLALSFSTLFLAKFISQSQANVQIAIDSRYQTSLSLKMDKAENWVAHTNEEYKYQLNYPKQWVGNLTSNNKNGVLHTYERFLSNKINIKITVLKDLQIPDNIKPAKFGKNDFYFTTDTQEQKTAVAHHNNLYYQIDLKQSAYFAAPEEFKGTFFQILKKFQLSSR